MTWSRRAGPRRATVLGHQRDPHVANRSADLERSERRRRLAALATVTDVYVWHLLRRREGLGRAAAEAEIRNLVEAARAGTATPAASG